MSVSGMVLEWEHDVDEIRLQNQIPVHEHDVMRMQRGLWKDCELTWKQLFATRGVEHHPNRRQHNPCQTLSQNLKR
jgi:hypothetical protein